MASFSTRAKDGVSGIWHYMVDHWGRGQAELYLGLIEAAVDALSRDPKLGRPCSEIRRGYRKHTVGSHVLYYRLKGGTIFVLRVLHRSMDPERHF
jgi:toxin ParE1/3/4